MIITTTQSVDGKTVAKYHGVITGEAIMGINVFKDVLANIRDIVGGRSGAYEQELEKARAIAFDEMSARARDLGADAVVGVDISYETIGVKGMLMVAVSGTAVSF